MLKNEIIKAILIVIVFWAGSYLITFLLNLAEKATDKTKSELDNRLIEASKLPIRYLAVLLGFFFAFREFSWSFTVKGRQFGLTDLIFILIAVLIAFTVSRMVKAIFAWYSESEKGKNVNQTMFVFSRKIVSVLVYLIAAMVVLSQFNIQIGPLLAGLGVAGLAIAFGLQETMANLFSALFLVMDKSINIGDWIQLEDGTKAYIEDISWRSVRIRTIAGNTVIVPNSKFVGQNISSYDWPNRAFYTNIKVGVAYDTDLEKAEYVALQAAEKVIRDLKIGDSDNNPIVRWRGFGDSSIDCLIIVKIDKVQDEGNVQHALIKQIKKDFEEAGIEIPFPQRVVHQAKSQK